MKAKKIISIILIIVGIIILTYPKISEKISQKNQLECIKKYETNIENTEEESKNREYEKAKIYNEKINGNLIEIKNDDYNNILNLSENGVMSYIEIPKIEVNLPIYHGTQDKELKKGIGHVENTSLPIGGKSTHCVLVGHTGLAKSKLFTRLNELQNDDIINIYTLGKLLKYKVYQIKVVLPSELNKLQIQENRDLVTLVTCTPYGINTHRLLVECERISDDATNEKETNKEVIEKNTEQKLNKIIIVLIMIFCCILLKKIVKYIQKVRKRK